MTRKEMVGILEIMQTAYPRFYQTQSQEDIKKAADLWTEMFKDDSTPDVVKAVKETIVELEYPPTIADIKQKVKHYVWEREWTKQLEQEQAEREAYLEELERKKLLPPPPEPKIDQEKVSEYVKKCKERIKGKK